MRPAFLFSLLFLASCNNVPEGDLTVAFIDAESDEPLLQDGLRLSASAQRVRAATSQGLVRFDANGMIVPALAERWIVTDDGASYIFRLRDTTWPDGEPVTADDVRQSLMTAMAQLEGTTLGLDLADIDDIRAMTGRVVEIRLKSAMPQFLQLLAQSELGVVRGRGGDAVDLGPMRAGAAEGNHLRLAPLPPQDRGLPMQGDWAELTRDVVVRKLDPERAAAAFSEGQLDLVTGGRLSGLPYVDVGPLARGTVRLDPAVGLFGLDVLTNTGFLAEASNREAIASIIDRDTLLESFSVGGWVPTTRIVPPNLPGFADAGEERWDADELEERRVRVSQQVAIWASQTDSAPTLSIYLPPGPGSDRLFARLAQDLTQVGIALERTENAKEADLRLRDRLARYLQPRWFLNQFNCDIVPKQCNPQADALIAQSITTVSSSERAALLRQAEEALLADNTFIPLGAPVRWSLVRANLAGFAENPLGVHPLFPLSGAPM